MFTENKLDDYHEGESSDSDLGEASDVSDCSMNFNSSPNWSSASSSSSSCGDDIDKRLNCRSFKEHGLPKVPAKQTPMSVPAAIDLYEGNLVVAQIAKLLTILPDDVKRKAELQMLNVVYDVMDKLR